MCQNMRTPSMDIVSSPGYFPFWSVTQILRHGAIGNQEKTNQNTGTKNNTIVENTPWSLPAALPGTSCIPNKKKLDIHIYM